MVDKYAWLEQCFSCYDRLHEIRYFQYFISFSWNHIFLKKISIYKETISLLFSKFITRRRLKKLKKKIVHNGIHATIVLYYLKKKKPHFPCERIVKLAGRQKRIVGFRDYNYGKFEIDETFFERTDGKNGEHDTN